MAICQRCKVKFSFFTIREQKRPNPLGSGNLCQRCYQPYDLVIEKYKANLKKIDTDPKAGAWVALCCLLAAQRINLVRTITAAISGFFETQDSWKTCKEAAIRLATNAMSMLPSDSEGLIFLQALLARAQGIEESPSREIPRQRYASVYGDSIVDIEYEAVVQSGVSIDELNALALSLPGHQWLLSF